MTGTGMKTVVDLKQMIGQKVLVRFDSQERNPTDFYVLCRILDAASSFGRIRLQIEAVQGEGTQWIDATRVRLTESREPSKNGSKRRA